MSERSDGDLLDLASDVAQRAKKAGADVAEVLARTSRNLSVKVRLGDPELVEEAGSSAVGLRVLKDGRSATTSTSDLSPSGLETLIRDALEISALSEQDPLSDPPPAADQETAPPDLDLYDPALEDFDGARARELAVAAETAARELDPRITNSEGATAGRTVGRVAFATSDGFAHGFPSSYVSLVVQPLADDKEGKKRVGFHWDARRHLTALAAPAEVGAEAARRTLAKLGPEKLSTCELPVVFAPEAARALLQLLCGCVGGSAVYKRQSYLADEADKMVASPLVSVVDDARLPRGPGSRPFDGEGLPSRRTEVVSGGRLQSFLLDTYSARKLGLSSTGSAARGVGGRPSAAPTNFHLLPGTHAPADLLNGIDRGLYVTSMMGFGFNAVTGDFSRGAEGFLIENGEKTKPVSEVTISLGFKELWPAIDAIANDLDPKAGLAAPSFRVTRMTIAGS